MTTTVWHASRIGAEIMAGGDRVGAMTVYARFPEINRHTEFEDGSVRQDAAGALGKSSGCHTRPREQEYPGVAGGKSGAPRFRKSRRYRDPNGHHSESHREAEESWVKRRIERSSLLGVAGQTRDTTGKRPLVVRRGQHGV